ncbi:MAG: DUF882 domain-containing protein [Rhodospirillaceae bacterium]
MTDRNTASKAAPSMCRRSFLRVGAATVAAASVLDPVDVLAAYGKIRPGSLGPARKLSLINQNTREHLFVEYWADGRYIIDGLRSISRLMRDHHDGTIHAIDPRLADVIYGVYRLAGNHGPIEVLCGYRSPRTNARMQASHSGVAGHSLHMQGKAVDIRLPGCGLQMLHRAALSLRAGGVGYYPHSNFVHIDSGPVRTWGGHGAEEDIGDAPTWRDALLSDTPKVQQAANNGLLPGRDESTRAIDAVLPRSRFQQATMFPGHKPMRLAMRDAAPVQSESFWVRRKPRVFFGG